MRIGTRTGAAVLLLMSCGMAMAASHRGSSEDQLACTPDVYRLCTAQIPDEDAIVACLKAHKAVLSAGCARVFSGPSTDDTVPQDDE